MKLCSLTLQHFRNHHSFHLDLTQPTVVIVGDNAQGKTSVLEAIVLLSTGLSFRADKVEEMISLNQEVGRVKATLADQDDDQTALEVILTRGVVQGKKTHSRLFSVNTVKRRKQDFVGHFFTVSFRPEDMRLMEGSPSRRRGFMDVPLGTVYPAYGESLSIYEQALKRRNKLLLSVREGEMPRSVLTYWNLQLLKHGQIIQKYRQDFLQFFTTVDFPVAFSVTYQSSLMTEARLAQYADAEIAVGHTLIGPHKDDLTVNFGTTSERESRFSSPTILPVSTYGSRGQQRMAVLWLKMCELAFLQTHTHQAPILLLDDILSELDHQARERVLHLLGQTQAIITTTEEKIIDEVRSVVPTIQVISLVGEVNSSLLSPELT